MKKTFSLLLAVLMLDDRNLGMADKAMEYLAGGNTVFLAVGVAHMVGDAGCTVERLDY